MSKYGKKPVYLKAETECLDETDTPVRLPRYTQFTIKNIISQNNSPYVFLELENIDGKNYKIKAAFTHTSVVDVIFTIRQLFYGSIRHRQLTNQVSEYHRRSLEHDKPR